MKIWKFQITSNPNHPENLPDTFELELPIGARLLSFQLQHGVPTLWVLLNPDNKIERRRFHLIGTGHPVPAVHLFFIGTIQLLGGDMVKHLFEEIK